MLDFAIEPNMKNENDDNSITRRLDLLIALTLDSLAADKSMQPAAKIRRLTDLGASAPEIAQIIGKPLNYVHATLSQQRAPKKAAPTRKNAGRKATKKAKR